MTNFTDQSTYCKPEVYSEYSQTNRPEITIEDIKHSDELVQFYTGLPDYATFNAVYSSIVQHGADRMTIDNEEITNSVSFRTLRLIDEFVMVMMRLRLGLLLIDLQHRFKVSSGRISRVFTAWIKFMHSCFNELIFLPKLSVLQQRVPKCFGNFSDTRVVLDCTELFVQTPSSLENKTTTYSHYKSHNTYKALVGISMTGVVVHVSKLWGGSASDVHITRNSGLLEQIEPGDAVMIDKGFIQLKSDLEKKNAKMYCPPFMSSKAQFSKAEVELSRRIASARKHVERKMEQIKNFRILQRENRAVIECSTTF